MRILRRMPYLQRVLTPVALPEKLDVVLCAFQD